MALMYWLCLALYRRHLRLNVAQSAVAVRNYGSPG